MQSIQTAVRRCLGGVAAAALWCGAGGALGGTIRDDKVADPFYTSPTFDPSVGRINYTVFDVCSAVLVAPDWVLTARHCLANNPSFTSFTLGDGATYPIDTARPFVSEPTGADLALFHLLPSASTGLLPSSSSAAVRYRGTTEAGNVATHVGYGYGGTGTGGVDTVNYPRGVRRAGDNRIDSYAQIGAGGSLITSPVSAPGFDYLLENFDANPALQTPHEWCVATGDSGGGMFIDVGGAPQLVGIHDLLAQDADGINSNYGDATLSLRVTQYNAWIDSTVPEPAMMGGVLSAFLLLRRGSRAWQ